MTRLVAETVPGTLGGGFELPLHDDQPVTVLLHQERFERDEARLFRAVLRSFSVAEDPTLERRLGVVLRLSKRKATVAVVPTSRACSILAPHLIICLAMGTVPLLETSTASGW